MSRDIVSDVPTHHSAEGVGFEPTGALRLQRFPSALGTVPTRRDPFSCALTCTAVVRLIPFRSVQMPSRLRSLPAAQDRVEDHGRFALHRPGDVAVEVDGRGRRGTHPRRVPWTIVVSVAR